MSSTPWDIYARQLFPLGYGHPLWIPEPQEENREVSIGDVGWLDEGGVHALFNSTKAKDHPINSKRFKVPDDFTMFNPANVYTVPCDRIQQQFVCSRNIRTINAQADMAGGGPLPVSAGVGFKFQTTADSGAFVLLQVPGRSEDIKSKRHIVNYMKDNFHSWIHLANSEDKWGLELKDEDIVFVSGTIKTSKWAVVSFQNTSFKRKEGHVSGDFGPFATVGFSVNISDQVLSTHHYRTGPSVSASSASTLPAIATSDSSQSPCSNPCNPTNQCLFVHYFKMKRRMVIKRPMQAAAGPHQLPPGPDTPGNDAIDTGEGTCEFEPEDLPERVEAFDPVNHLLDYILLQSDATCAVASDIDLVAIFPGDDFPDDIPAALLRAAPFIEVDERGVGTVSVDYQFNRPQEQPIEAGCELESLSNTPEHCGIQPQDDISSQDPPSLQRLEMSKPAYAPQDAPKAKDSPDRDDDGDGDVRSYTAGRVAGKRPDLGGPTSTHGGSVSMLAYSADGSFAASGSEDTTIILWDVRENTAMYKTGQLGDTVSSLAFSRDGRVLASATHEGLVLWKVGTGRMIREISVDPPISTVAYTPDGARLIGGGIDGALHVWNATTYELEGTVPEGSGNMDVVSFIVFSRDGRLVATGGTENVCCIWETAALAHVGAPCAVLRGHEGMVSAAAFAPDNRRIITASEDCSSRVWNAETGEALVILHEHTGPVWAVAFSPDGKRVASGSSDATVRVYDSFEGEQLLCLEGHGSMINAVDFSADGKYIASASSDNTVRLWDAYDGTYMAKFNEHNDNVSAAMFSPDGTSIMSGSHDGTVYIRALTRFAQETDEAVGLDD